MTTSNARTLLCFAHGKESGPWGIKIERMAKVAEDFPVDVISPDFRFSQEPEPRIEHLINEIGDRKSNLILVGSSMGGYICAHACAELKPKALFLIAPALYFAGYDAEPESCPQLTTVIHGWGDDIVTVDKSIRFAQSRRATLHLLDAGHTLNDRLDDLDVVFRRFMQQALG